MADIIAGIANETLILIGVQLFFTGTIIYFYRFSNKKLVKRMKDLKRKDNEMYKLVEKINSARAREHREVNKRMDKFEKQVQTLLKPEGPEKEFEMEKLLLER
ncbi:MAG: hypothetical protein ABIH20_02410 [Candidatus Diapherotrites archaeon]